VNRGDFSAAAGSFDAFVVLGGNLSRAQKGNSSELASADAPVDPVKPLRGLLTPRPVDVS
jgi:hypothetical protein